MQEAAAGFDSAMTALILRDATLDQIANEVSKIQTTIDKELGQNGSEPRREVVQIGNINMEST